MDYLALTVGGKTIDAPGTLPSGGVDTLSTAISGGIQIMIIVAILLSLVFLVLGGIQWTSSGGDKGKISAARSKITFAIVGLIVALSAFGIASIFGNFFGVSLFGN
jgi:hypothetical protein